MTLLAATVPPTLPPADARLYGPDTFGAWWLVGAIAAATVAALGFAWALWPRRRPTIPAERPDALGLRQRYLRRFDELEQQVVAQQMTPRALHHELSRTLRRFAEDLGTDRASTMSAVALDEAGQRGVAAAVRRFEHPQFEAEPRDDPLVALSTARAVVSDADLPPANHRSTGP